MTEVVPTPVQVETSAAAALQPVTLDGVHVMLEPLSLSHHAELCDVGLDPELWRWTIAAALTPDDLMRYLEEAMVAREAGSALPFLIRERATGKAVGSTRFGNIDMSNRRVEIGWTWIGRPWQRTAINTEMKLLLLTHAFETLGCNRVELKTDALNATSRAAIKRLGAVEEGTLRQHMVTASGRIRDTVYYSITKDEWPVVRAGLRERLQVNTR
jgi:RimJ/RimL family protein N-acetyltransferase